MSKQLISNYVYNVTNKTVTLSDFTTVKLERLQLITNTTTNQIIYNFADSTVATATVSGNVITLSAAPGSNTDKLMIIYDALATDPVYDATTVKNPTASNFNSVVYGYDSVGLGNPALAADSSGRLITKLSDGTNQANVLKSDGTSAGGNSLLTSGASLSVPFTTTTAQAVGTTDAAPYSWLTIQITSQGTSSTVNYQVSNDNVNWISLYLYDIVNNGLNLTGSSNLVRTVTGPITGRYVRLNVTGISAGTTAGTMFFSVTPRNFPSQQVQASIAGTWTVGSNSATGSAVPANAFLMGMVGNSSLLTAPGAASIAKTGANGNSAMAVGTYAYNGTTYDGTVSATAGAGTTGTGVPAAGMLGFDGTNYQRVKTDTAGVVSVAQQSASSSAITSVTGAITSTTVLAANTNRKGAYFFNSSTATLYLAYAATASTSAYTLQIPPNSFYEMPYKPLYTGLITGIWSAANGAVLVTELS